MTNLPLVCAVELNCGYCRNADSGQTSRDGIAVENGWQITGRWECPFGKPWGYVVEDETPRKVLPSGVVQKNPWEDAEPCPDRGEQVGEGEGRSCCDRKVPVFACGNPQVEEALGYSEVPGDICNTTCPQHPEHEKEKQRAEV